MYASPRSASSRPILGSGFSTRGHGVGCTGDRVTGGHAALDRVEVERVHVVDRFHAAAF